jgi:hypothetical protein
LAFWILKIPFLEIKIRPKKIWQFLRQLKGLALDPSGFEAPPLGLLAF